MKLLNQCLITVLLVVVPNLALAQQDADNSWVLVVGVNRLAGGVDEDWSLGPALRVGRRLGDHFGIEMEGTWLTTNAVEDVYSGVIGSLGAAWSWRSERTAFSFGTGFIAATVVSQTGYQDMVGRGSSVGVYAGVSGAYWFGSTVGVSAGVSKILWYGDTGTNLGAGLALRW